MCPIDAKKRVPGAGGEGAAVLLFLFFLSGRVPGMGPMGQQCSKVHLIALANVIKRCSQTPIPRPGYPLVVLAPARAVAVGYRCYPSRGGCVIKQKAVTFWVTT
jgi:hypothetical protein